MDEHYHASRRVQHDFDRIEMPGGGYVYEPKRPALRMLGKPPWEIEVVAFDGIIPDETVDLIGAVIWRGVRFVRETAHDADEEPVD